MATDSVFPPPGKLATTPFAAAFLASSAETPPGRSGFAGVTLTFFAPGASADSSSTQVSRLAFAGSSCSDRKGTLRRTSMGR